MMNHKAHMHQPSLFFLLFYYSMYIFYPKGFASLFFFFFDKLKGFALQTMVFAQV